MKTSAKQMVDNLTNMVLDFGRMQTYNEDTHNLILEIRKLKNEIIEIMEETK